jgi:acryloyl-coenzyme A reductase
MRAVVLRQTGGPENLILEEKADPKLEADDVLVRVRASAVCGRDLIDRRGGMPLMKLPTILGHEFAGEIVAMGPGAVMSGFSVSDRVVNLHLPSCGNCRRCLVGETIAPSAIWKT